MVELSPAISLLSLLDAFQFLSNIAMRALTQPRRSVNYTFHSSEMDKEVKL
jgi:hypothetical protein